MILINLLPHREERRKRRRQAFFAGLGIAAVLGLLVGVLWYLLVTEFQQMQASRNAFLQSEIRRLEVQIKDIASLKSEIESLKARQKVVEDFQIDRNMPVHLLNELVRQTPEGVYLSALRQDGQVISLTGLAQTNERVSEFLRNTAYGSAWLDHPELIEIKAAAVSTSGRDSKRLYEFSVRLTLKRPQDKAAEAAASAPSAAGSAPAPARAASAVS
jgi:type IV pilus assembly protein PilN